MDNSSAFQVSQYDENVRKVIPFYDTIYSQIFDLIKTFCSNKPIALLDTGCGTGTFGRQAYEQLPLSALVLCDPSKKMLGDARKKLYPYPCEYFCMGSEQLTFDNQFDVVTAIQSHHYFDKATRKTAVSHCFRALKEGGLFVYFENTAPVSAKGKDILLERLENFQTAAGRPLSEVKAHSARYNREFFPITIREHFQLLQDTGFRLEELFWHSYMQSGFYAVK